MQAFQLSDSKAPSPAPTESSGGAGIQLPSIGLPSVSLPSLPVPDLSGLNISPSGGLDPRTIALPGMPQLTGKGSGMAAPCPTNERSDCCEGAILGIGAAAFAALRIDPGFKELMREGLVKVHSDLDTCLPFVDTSPSML